MIIATGDANQLETIDLISSEIDYDEYTNNCINMIFPHNIYLKQAKRSTTEAANNRLKYFKADMFNKAIPMRTTLRTYCKVTND